MKITFLGTGTSTGVPQIGCKCPVCTSTDSRDCRLRASALLSISPRDDTPVNILIDCGPDFRTQILRINSPSIHALFITHSHYDHVGGIDDLRPYCIDGPFNVWCRSDVANDLRNRNPWSFKENPYPGVPTFNLHEIAEFEPFTFHGIKVTPLQIMHASLPILGYKFEFTDSDGVIKKIAYITDCKTMPRETLDIISGLDLLVINALRHNEHLSHLSLSQALEIIEKTSPKSTYLTHFSHEIGLHSQIELPPHVHAAFDGLSVNL